MSKENNKIKIENIELNLGGNKVKLSLGQARELKDILNELFKEVVVKEKEYIPYPQPIYPVQPIYIEKEPYFPTNPWITWCSTTDGSDLVLTAKV